MAITTISDTSGGIASAAGGILLEEEDDLGIEEGFFFPTSSGPPKGAFSRPYGSEILTWSPVGKWGALQGALLGLVKVAVISGGSWAQFQAQLLSKLTQEERLKNLSLLPTCGTQFYRVFPAGLPDFEIAVR